MRTTRAQAVARVRQQLVQQGFPRLQMAWIVVLTGGFGLLTSFCLLQAGLGSMTLRYPLALCVAYLFFLGLIWLWLRTQADDWLNALQLPDAGPGCTGAAGPGGVQSGGGGDFAGAGASGAFDSPAAATLDNAAGSPIKALGDAASSGPDLDELAIPLAAIGLALGLALASVYVVYIAPVLLAEVLVDGALAYALLRRLKGQDPQHWLASTWRHTWLPFLATALFLAAAGAVLSTVAPGAQSIGQVLAHRGAGH